MYQLISLVINLEEKQQTTLTEWYSAQENTFSLNLRDRAIPNVTEEYDLLDDGGDAVFSQLVRPQWFYTDSLSENCTLNNIL